MTVSYYQFISYLTFKKHKIHIRDGKKRKYLCGMEYASSWDKKLDPARLDDANICTHCRRRLNKIRAGKE